MMNPSYTLPDTPDFFQTTSQFPDVFTPRQAESHKGTYGTLTVVGGASGMSGAVVLASTAAIYQGSGKVWAGFNQTALPFAVIPERPEIMLATAEDLLKRKDISAWAVGCGMGLDETASQILNTVLTQNQDAPLLLDADALTLLARSHPETREAAQKRSHLVLTPHPAEAARLLGISTQAVQQDRMSAVQTISTTLQAVTVLKGHHTLVATPDGTVYTNPSGNAGLATAGSGDVLSGIIGSLLAQGIPPFQAACAGVWLHGAAADVIKHSTGVEAGMLAGEIAPTARWLRNRLMIENTKV